MRYNKVTGEKLMFIKWKKDYETGNPIVDHQHQHLVDIANELYDSIKEHGDIDHAYITFKELIQYTQTHFAQEETLMQNIKYKDFEKHKKQHQELIKTIHDLKDKFDSNKKEICVKTILFLKEWLIDHIVAEDLKCAPYIRNMRL